ncbi:DinB family protein [Muricauda sp. NFXS6]|uniref:DinB family protein n=1 Tax=Allomuricauda sp. NFXS6 TaxID=2819094 RepID=UPI0032E013C3
MKHLFTYNWMIRDEWFDLLADIPKKELTLSRTGGPGTILETLFHIVKVEHNWIRDLKERPISSTTYADMDDKLEKIRELSDRFHEEVREFVMEWDGSSEGRMLHLTGGNGNEIRCTYGEALRHIIVHEVHHIGQLSIWAREIGIPPVSSNLIHRRIMLA